MKIPDKVSNYCRKCKTHKVMTVKQEKGGRRSGGLNWSHRRMKARRRGHGNLGRYSKKPVTQTKMASKTSKKIDLRLTCPDCGKVGVITRPRSKRVEITRTL
ncbi:MAG: 50S ribosomal protein L44e [Candidatus Heimdallarchaeota archaeon]|nr:50S ribosomal protein L44e [Candidatus Heimdallarchaeota archaeon]